MTSVMDECYSKQNKLDLPTWSDSFQVGHHLHPDRIAPKKKEGLCLFNFDTYRWPTFCGAGKSIQFWDASATSPGPQNKKLIKSLRNNGQLPPEKVNYIQI